jgi:ABC-type transport system substrate-binding protein
MTGSRIVRQWSRIGAALILVPVLAGCSGAPAAPSPANEAAPQVATPASASATQPVPPPQSSQPAASKSAVQPSTQRLVISVVTPARESNDVRMVGNLDIWHIRPMYEYLVGLDPDNGKYVPQLATEWNIEPNGTSIRMKLRQNVPFHGGYGTFSAKDVLFSWEEMKKDDTPNGWVGWFKNAIKDIEVVNDHEVIFHLSREDSNFLNIVSEGENGFEMRSKAHAEAMGAPLLDGQPYAGTGPYQFKERAQGQYIRFGRVPYQHWRVTPDFPELEFRFQKEASTRLAGLIAGETHMAVLPHDLLVEAEKKGMSSFSSRLPGLRTFMSPYCCSVNDPQDPSKGYMYPDSPLQDLRVRKALNKAINRDEMNRAFLAGKGERMILPAHHPTRQGWDPSWEARFQDEYGYDVAAARQLLAEAGYTGGKTLSTNVFLQPLPSITSSEDMTEAIAGYWRAVGVQVELLSTDPTEIRNLTRQRKYSNHFELRSSNAAMFTTMTGYFLMTGGRANNFEDYDVDRYALAAVSTFDEKKQDENWRQVGELMFSRQSSIPLYWLPAPIVYNPKFVADYHYPGNVTGTWTHTYTLKSAT